MLTDLERDLRDVLTREADQVELSAEEWAGPRPAAGRPTRRRVVAAAAVALVAAGVGTLVWRQPVAEPAPAQQPTATVPDGVEIPLRRLSFDELSWGPTPLVVAPVRPGSLRAYEALGHQFVVWDTIEYRGGPGIVEVRCVEDEQRYGWCRAAEGPVFDLGSWWIWRDVPASASFVTARTSLSSRWQRPVDGLVAFPTGSALTAIDADGREVGRTDRYDPGEGEFVADNLDADEQAQVGGAATASALDCLGSAGIDPDPRRPAPVNADLAWARCVAVASAVTAAVFEVRGGQLLTTRPALDPSVRDVWGDSVDLTCVVGSDDVQTCTVERNAVGTGG